MDQQRHSDIDTVIGLLAPATVFSEFPAVVSPQNNNRVLVQLQFSQGAHQLTKAGVNETDRRVVAMFVKVLWQRHHLGKVLGKLPAEIPHEPNQASAPSSRWHARSQWLPGR